MKIIKKKLTELVRPEKNIRLHTDKQIKEFKRSVEMFGQIRPIVIDENNVMLAGNGLYETLLQMGYDSADCYVVNGLTEAQKKKLMLADNRIFDLGNDDMAAFDQFILELGDDLDVPGFDEGMLRSLVMDSSDVDELISDYGKIPEERAEEIRNAGTRYDAPNREIERSTSSEPEAHTETPTEKSVVCPKCGETIWL
jgi:hypothetical protein